MSAPDGTIHPPAGWYPDPWRIFPTRWWDGTSWAGNPPARFVGGMNVPTRAGFRLNATVPLAVLTIDATSLTMHPRPFPFPMFSDFQVALSDIAVAFRLRGSPVSSGVGIEVSDGNVAYFWTLSQQDLILAELHQRGVALDPAPRRAAGALSGQFAWLWRWRKTDAPSVATLPGLTRLMVLITPVGIVGGLALAVSFALMGGLFGLIAPVVAGFGLIQTVRLWLASRN